MYLKYSEFLSVICLWSCCINYITAAWQIGNQLVDLLRSKGSSDGGFQFICFNGFTVSSSSLQESVLSLGLPSLLENKINISLKLLRKIKNLVETQLTSDSDICTDFQCGLTPRQETAPQMLPDYGNFIIVNREIWIVYTFNLKEDLALKKPRYLSSAQKRHFWNGLCFSTGLTHEECDRWSWSSGYFYPWRLLKHRLQL